MPHLKDLYDTTQLEFVECDTCRAKPGSPLLCDGCLRNRFVISTLKERCKLESATKKFRERYHKARGLNTKA
jgi:hypothetical protein